MSKSVVRSVKNVTKGYTSVQIKVRNATSNDAWGPTGTEMAEIAQMTYNSSSDFYEIMDMLDKRLNDKGKNWRHVLKSLKVLDYILHEGSELVVTWSRKNIFVIKTLREFQHIDEDSRDVGLNVRQSAKELTSLILDEERLRAERHDRKLWKSRVTGLDEFDPTISSGGISDPPRPRERRERNKQGKTDEEDLEYRLALEASKNEMEEDRRRRANTAPSQNGGGDDADLARAIKLSKEEEELRRRELEQSNAASLFDDTPTQQAPQATGWNQGYQQQSAVDWFGNPVEQQQQQQPQSTGYLNNMYSQPSGVQAQQTGFGQNPYGQQPQYDQSQFQQQPQYIQPQQTAFNMNNPYGGQANGFGQSQPQQQPQDNLSPGTNNPWSTTNHNEPSIAPQPTGSNNPFASSSFSRPQPQQSAARAPSLNTLAEQKPTTQFTNTNAFSNSASAFTASNRPPPAHSPLDPHAARLNALLATGDGQDTFGNVGNMRIPAQHTAPSTFVNSAGSTLGRLQPVQTGVTNPFMQSHMTGYPTASQQMPAQTGGFGGGGYGSNAGNPFGAQRGQQQGGSLIDF